MQEFYSITSETFSDHMLFSGLRTMAIRRFVAAAGSRPFFSTTTAEAAAGAPAGAAGEKNGESLGF